MNLRKPKSPSVYHLPYLRQGKVGPPNFSPISQFANESCSFKPPSRLHKPENHKPLLNT